jgi:OOP family OmpA-OmpF porin
MANVLARPLSLGAPRVMLTLAMGWGFMAGSHAQQPPRPSTEPSTGMSSAAVPSGPVVVSGVVPDEAARQTILTRVREIYGPDRVVDQLGVAPSSAPPQWAEQVRKMVTPDLRNVHRGQLRVVGNAVELAGQTDSASVKDRIGAGLVKSLNPTYTVDNQLLVGQAPQARIDQVLAGKIVEFEFGSAVLTATGRQVLDELLPVLQSLEGKKVRVVGHTDAAGSRASNLLLSQERAAAVKTYLAGKGLAAAALVISGAGPDQPIASNATAEGQAKNRRIEFKIDV